MTIVQKDFTAAGNGDEHGHSTHTAGTIFGRPIESSWSGSAVTHRFGVAPGITGVLVAKVLDDSGRSPDGAALSGLSWALDRATQPDVICVPMGTEHAYLLGVQARSSASEDEATQQVAWGLHKYLQELRTYRSLSVLASLVGKGCVLVMPAGNDSRPGARVPVTSSLSAIEGVISVGAVERSGERYTVAGYSNTMPTLCAPGSRVLSSGLGGRVTEMSGTSMACAQAAGVAALWWERLRAQYGQDEVTSRMVVEAMLTHARTDLFVDGVEESERGAGLVQAPLG